MRSHLAKKLSSSLWPLRYWDDAQAPNPNSFLQWGSKAAPTPAYKPSPFFVRFGLVPRSIMDDSRDDDLSGRERRRKKAPVVRANELRIEDSAGLACALLEFSWVQSLIFVGPVTFPSLQVPWKIGESLTSISLMHSGLTQLPWCFTKLPSLENIVLCNNQLSDISPILEATRLRRLCASHNQIRVIPDSLSELTNLEELRLSHNYLETTLPIGLSRLTRLLDLRVNNNNLIALPGQLAALDEPWKRASKWVKPVFGFSRNPWFNLRKRGALGPVYCPFAPADLRSHLFHVTSLEAAMPFVLDDLYAIFYVNNMVPRDGREEDAPPLTHQPRSLLELCCREVLRSLKRREWNRRNLLPADLLHRLNSAMCCVRCKCAITESDGFQYRIERLGNKCRHGVGIYYPICNWSKCAKDLPIWNENFKEFGSR